MNGSRQFEIAVVGGGPAGSVAAILLARAGFRVVVMDAEKQRRRKVCGEFLCHEGAEILKNLDLFHVIQRYRFLPGMGATIVTSDGTVVSGLFPQGLQHKPGGYCLNRSLFDAALLGEAERLGVSLMLGKRVTELTRSADGWQISTCSGEKLTADLLIGADGIHSTVAHLLGLSLQPQKKRLALRCFLPTRYPNPRMIELHLLNNGNYIGIDVVEEHRVNFSIVTDAAELKKHGGAEGLIRYYYTSRPGLRTNMILPDEMPDIEAISPVTHEVRSCISNHAVLIGDAGGFIEPLTGEGITIALWSAAALAKHLIATRKDWRRRQSALRAYANEKKRHYLQKRLFTYALHWFIRQESLCNVVCRCLKDRPKSVEAFMGVINNTFRPIPGAIKLLWGMGGHRQTGLVPCTPTPDFGNIETSNRTSASVGTVVPR